MCRFLIIKSNKKIKAEKLLKEFALVCEKVKAPNGDWQGDGFGVAWKEGEEWENRKSLEPIWKNLDILSQVPESNLIVAHARSASSEKDIGNIEFNQPFLEGDLAFVFNGFLKGVRLNIPLEGKIGAQKLFSLLKLELNSRPDPLEALEKTRDLVLRNTKEVEGMNIGFLKGEKAYFLCQYLGSDYYQLKYSQTPDLTLISSEGFGEYNWENFKKGEVKSF